MKRVLSITIFVIALIFGASLSSYCQVSVPQEFLDDCNQAFKLVAVQRDQLANYAEKDKLTKAERDSALALVASMDSLMAVKDRTILSYETLVKTLQNAIEIQSKIIDILEKRLLKPRSFLEKTLKALKEFALVTAGVILGRGL